MSHADVYPIHDAPASETPEMTDSRPARATDASRLTFTAKMMIGAIMMTATIIAAVYGMTNGIRESQLKTESDIRNLQTRMEMQLQIDNARNETRAMELKTQSAAIDELKRLTQLLQLQYAQLEKKVK